MAERRHTSIITVMPTESQVNKNDPSEPGFYTKAILCIRANFVKSSADVKEQNSFS